MRLAASAVLLLLMQDRVCEHPSRGETRAMDLDVVARAYRDAAHALAWMPGRVPPGDPLDAAYDSGLPACRGRARRSVRIEELPRDLVGQTLAFAETAPLGAIHVISSTRALRVVQGGVLATPKLAERFGVRCAPSRVRIVSTTEVAIDEDD